MKKILLTIVMAVVACMILPNKVMAQDVTTTQVDPAVLKAQKKAEKQARKAQKDQE